MQKAPTRSGLPKQGLALNLTIGAYGLENRLYDCRPCGPEEAVAHEKNFDETHTQLEVLDRSHYRYVDRR